MTFISSKPAAIVNLITALRAELGEYAVKDGPTVSWPKQDELFVVGSTGPDSPAAVDGTSTPEGLRQPYREQYSIHCRLEVVTGTPDLSAVRQRAAELFGVVADVLTADKTLGGAVLQASIGADDWSQSQDSGGSRVVIGFDVDCDAFWRKVT